MLSNTYLWSGVVAGGISDSCEECGAQQVTALYKQEKTPFADGVTEKKGCIFCFADFVPLVRAQTSVLLMIILTLVNVLSRFFTCRLKSTKRLRCAAIRAVVAVAVVSVVEVVRVAVDVINRPKTRWHSWPPTLCSSWTSRYSDVFDDCWVDVDVVDGGIEIAAKCTNAFPGKRTH